MCKKKLKNSNLIPKYILLPDFKKIKNNKKYYLNKIFNFYKNKNFNIHVKSDGKHHGEGIIRINEKISKPKFKKSILHQYLIYLKKLNRFILKRQ